MNFGWAAAAAAAFAAPAGAQWHQASSKHFVIYGDMPEAEMRDYAERLEKFDAAARVVRSMTDPVVGDGNRVQVFVASSMLEVNRLYGGNADTGILGYYVGNASGPFIVTPRKIRRFRDGSTQDPDTTFFHEYTHHLQLQSTNKPMPAWLSEGFAEFLSDPIFGPDGSVGLGTPVKDRAEQIYQAKWAPLAALLEGDAYKLSYNDFWHQNYAQGWLLNHYLAFEPSRRGQIDAYVKRIEAGEPPLTAARAAFGDIRALEKELIAYKSTKKFPYLKVETAKLKVEPVTVTRLATGAAEAMPYRIHVKTGYGAASKRGVVAKLRDIAGRHPGDLLVLRTLAEAEFDNDNFDQAANAADAALKIDPNSIEALIYKGRATMSRAKKAKDQNGFEAARKLFVRANKLDPEDPEPLYLYFRSYVDSGAAAPRSALEAAKYAAVLAPRDYTIAGELVYEYLRQNKLNEAATTLKPVAYMPHFGQGRHNHALRVLALIEKGQRDEAMKLTDKELLEDDEG
ncbi:MAG TPA: hypothetical protein VFO42_05895 [Sphingomicrobium sp.]|nr:hypothetical protein [Sphingomicrobium sp.]